MDKVKINEIRKQIYDLAEVLKAEAEGEDYEIANEAQSILNSCDEIEAYLEDDPADYEATKRDISLWLDREIGVPA